MLATAVIVLREVLEAALVVSIVLAATRGVPGRASWVSFGVAGGVLGAMVVAAFAKALAAAASGIGQEIFNASVLFVAVVMLGWHNVWMTRHGREMASNLSSVGAAVRGGTKPLYMLAVVVMLAVLREGSELVLFLYGIATSGPGQSVGLAGGFALGLLGGMALAFAMYFGLLRVPAKRLFAVTGWLILLLAAGMAAQGAAFLVQADILPTLGDAVWDTSKVVSDESLVGRLLHTLVGYTARPYGIQIGFYVATLVVLLLLMKLFAQSPPPNQRQSVPL
ncbi:MAG: FTR1 family protein [Burkholderiales bacterium]